MSGINEDLTREVEQFLYREARLLDERRFHEWLELLTDDVRHWMGSRSNRYPKSSKAIAILNPDRYVEDDLTKEDELAILDETTRRAAGYWHGLGRGPAVAQPPPDNQYRGRTRRRGERGQSLLEFYGLPQPGGDRAGLLRRCPARRPATNRRRVEDRRSQSDPRPERLAGQERQHLLLSFLKSAGSF